MKHIKNIIFDLGVVLINLDYSLTVEGFHKLGVSDFSKNYSYQKQQLLFDNFEMGMLTPSQFCDEIRQLTGIHLSNEQIINAWNSMLLDFPEKRVNLLKALKDNYRLFLLSNTNQIHVEAFTKTLLGQYGFDIFKELFEKAYFSSDIGLRKPDIRIFEYVLNAHNLKPEETLFIDDLEANINAARQAGIDGLLLEPGQDVVHLLRELITHEL